LNPPVKKIIYFSLQNVSLVLKVSLVHGRVLCADQMIRFGDCCP